MQQNQQQQQQTVYALVSYDDVQRFILLFFWQYLPKDKNALRMAVVFK